jgi:acyl-coenzyme A thioesterase PaaI-like protein
MRIASVEPGRVVFELEVGEHLYNRSARSRWDHLDGSRFGHGLRGSLEPRAGQGYTTLELKVNFDRALTVHGAVVRAEADIVTSGRRVATAVGRLVGPDGTLYAHASTTCLVFDTAV